MHKALIESEDSFFCMGLMFILDRIHKEKVSITQTNRFIQQDNEFYDYYFFPVDAGDAGVCHPKILSAPTESQIYLIVREESDVSLFDNKCLQGCAILKYDMRIQQIESIIVASIKNKRRKIECAECYKPCLTEKEILILGLYLSGVDIMRSSSYLNASEKSIYSHLGRIKRKLGVSNKKELHFIMSKYVRKATLPTSLN